MEIETADGERRLIGFTTEPVTLPEGKGLITMFQDISRLQQAEERRRRAEQLAYVGDLAARLPEGAVVFGTGVEAYPGLFAATRFAVGPAAYETGRAEAVARLGRERILAGEAVDPTDLVPPYYRLTEAEERLAAAAAAEQ